ncbi:MAG: hypothetical protein AAFQ84_10515 [Pseudomonadota bacterium]
MTKSKPPVAPRKPREIEQHGLVRHDPYAWLKDENWQQVMRDPSVLRADIRAYLEAENDYTKVHLETPLAALVSELVAEMRGRIKEDDTSVPAKDGAYAYFTRFRDNGEYPLFVRRVAETAFDEGSAEELLFDGDAEGAGEAYFDIGTIAHAPDHGKIAFAVDRQGSEYYALSVRDLETGETVDTGIDKCTGDFVWSGASDALFWVERNENGRSCAVWRRSLTSMDDVLIYREPDEGFFVGVSESQSGDLIFISSNDHTTSEWRWLDARTADATPHLIAKRQTGHEYSCDHGANGRPFSRSSRMR